ncbi:nickel transporter permease [Paenibacillus thalictri]|nr:nickel transporter permease [Paenibacillus thalictri]
MDNRFRQRLFVALKKDPLAVFLLAILAVVIVMSIGGAWFSGYDPLKVDYKQALLPPSGDHWLGTDNYGRDVLSRLMHGGASSLGASVLAVSLIISLGLLIGLAAGYFGGWVDMVLTRLMDVLFSFPQLVLAIALASLLGPGLMSLMIAVAAVAWPSFARIFRSYVLSVRNEGYVLAAKTSGIPAWKIIGTHILGSIAGPILVLVTLDMGNIILSIASMSFLGLGIRPPQPEWGAMLNEGRAYIEEAPWLFLAPGLTIFATVLATNYLGDTLKDALEPRTLHMPRLFERRKKRSGSVEAMGQSGRESAAGDQGPSPLAQGTAQAAESGSRLPAHTKRGASANSGRERSALAKTSGAVPPGGMPFAAGAAGSRGDQAAENRACVLSAEGLCVSARAERGGSRKPILEDIGLQLQRGECLGLVGESGSGKSTLALALMGLLRSPLETTSGTIRLLGADTRLWEWNDWRKARGSRIAYITQDPMDSLNPVLTVGEQLQECLAAHRESGAAANKSEIKAKVLKLLQQTGLAAEVYGQYPHQLSGGMRQRVVIAMAIVNEPQIIIADEPTTALDVSTQARIMELLATLQRERNMSMIFITHDLRLVANIADRICVMKNGRMIEQGDVRSLFTEPREAYTQQLLKAIPSLRIPPHIRQAK